MGLHPRRAMGVFGHPLAGFRRFLKNVRAVIFGMPVHISFLHMLWKFQNQASKGQVIRSFKVRSPCYVKWPQLRKSYIDWAIALKLQPLIRVTVCLKCLFRKFDIGALRSGHFAPSHLWANGIGGGEWKAPVLDGHRSKHSTIGLQVNLTHWIGKLRPVTPPHVTEVISGHKRSPAVCRQWLLIVAC